MSDVVANPIRRNWLGRLLLLTLLQKCILVSLLLHVLLIGGFGAMRVGQAIVAYVRDEVDMEVPLSVESGLVAQVQHQVRNPQSELPQPPAPVDLPRMATFDVPIEPPPQLSLDLPSAAVSPSGMTLRTDPPVSRPPAPIEPPAVEPPPVETVTPQLILRDPPKLSAVDPSPVDAPQPESPRVEPRMTAPALEIVLGTVPLQPDTDIVGPTAVSLSPEPPRPQPAEGPSPAVSRIDPEFSEPRFDLPRTSPAAEPGAPPLPAVPVRRRPAVELPVAPPLELPVQTLPVPDRSLAQIQIAQPSPTVEVALELPVEIATPQVAPPPVNIAPVAEATAVASIEPPRASLAHLQAVPRRVEDLKPRETRLSVDPVDDSGPALSLGDPLGSRGQEDRTETLALPTGIASLPGLLGPTDLLTTDTLVQRAAEQRKAVIEELGGSERSEQAVARALGWLARNQDASGRWTQFDSDAYSGRGRDHHDPALTGLATLCFLAADHTHQKPGPYQQNIARGLAYLASIQQRDGDLRGRGNMYDHAIATIALAEATSMTGDNRYREAVLRAARFIVASQNHESGGWQYAPGEMGDTTVVGWQLMALHSAERLGFHTPPQTRQGAIRWLQRVQRDQNSILSGYMNRTPTPANTAQALFSRIMLGMSIEPDALNEAVRFISSQPPGTGETDYYYWYYGSLSLMQLQNDAWNRWNLRTREHLVGKQRTDGPAAGSWDPVDQWSNRGGRVYSTAFATLTLEVYYRYLPTYRAR